MTLGHPGILLAQPFASYQLPTKHTMHYIWLLTMTVYIGSIGKKYAYIMKHRRLTYLVTLKRQCFFFGNLERELRHSLAMSHIYYPPESLRRVISVNDLLICHEVYYSTIVHHPCLSSISPRRIALRVS